MKKAIRMLLMVIMGLTLLSGCMPEEHQEDTGSELRDEDGRLDGIDFDKGNQGDDTTYSGFKS